MSISSGRIRRYIPALARDTFIVLEVPKRFPLFMAAVLALKAAMNANNASIRVEREGSQEHMEWDVPYVYQEAIRLGLMKSSMGVAQPGDIEKRFKTWSGAAFPAKELING